MKVLKIIVLIVIMILILLRLALPYYLLNYVEKQINKIPEYKVKIDDLDVHLYRGAYTLKHIQLWKITKNIPVPFYEAKVMDFSIEWGALLHGKLLAKIVIQQPKINFVTEPSGTNEQVSISTQWLDAIKSLYPLNINRVDAHNGQVSLISYKGNPPFKIYTKNTELMLLNMQEATEKSKLLSSSFKCNGDMVGGGNVDIQGKFNPFIKQPTFKMQVKMTSLNVASIANFLKHYSSIDVSAGTFSMYGEAVAANGRIDGYVKPFIKNLKIGTPKKEANPISVIVNGAATVVAKVLENSKQKTIATKINISGNVDDPDTSIFSIILYLIKHAFIQALLPQVDHTVGMQDVLMGKHPSNVKDKFPDYKN